MWLQIVIVTVFLAVALLCTKPKHPLKTVGSGAVQGLCSLAAVQVTGLFTGVTLPFTMSTALFSAVLGVPGVIGLLCVKLIFSL